MKNFELCHWSKVESVEVMQAVIANIKNFKLMESEKTTWLSIFVQFDDCLVSASDAADDRPVA